MTTDKNYKNCLCMNPDEVKKINSNQFWLDNLSMNYYLQDSQWGILSYGW